MTHYRIIGNGKVFRVQRRSIFGFWLTEREHFYGGSQPWEFATQDIARAYIATERRINQPPPPWEVVMKEVA